MSHGRDDEMNSFAFDGVSIQNGRKTNMDSLLIKEKTLLKRKICIAVICDGIGSLPDGAFASAQAVRMMHEWFDLQEDTVRIGLRLRDAVQQVDVRISEDAANLGLHTGTTLSAMLLDGESFYVVHVGDSRVYSVGAEGLETLTVDQVSNGKLTSCVGRGNARIFYNEGRCAGRRFLLCSDGLYKRMDDALLERELRLTERRSCKRTIQRLTDYVTERGESDNVSLAIVICES